jgi:VWFA-related protein
MNSSHRMGFALTFCVATSVFAQQSAPPPNSVTAGAQEPALSERPAPATGVAEGRIKLDVVVIDRAGNPVGNLDSKNFTLFDSNQPAKIASFRAIPLVVASTDPQLTVTLVLDTVNVGFQHVLSARQEIARFLRESGGHLTQPVSIFVLTNDGLTTHLPPSTDGNALADELDHLGSQLRTIDRAQGNWGDIQRFAFSMAQFDKILDDQETRSGRKLLVWVGYGWPMLNGLGFAFTPEAQQRYFDAIVQLSTRLRESHIVLSSVSLGEVDPLASSYRGFLKPVVAVKKANPGNLALKVLATQSGGWILGPDNDLASQIHSCIAGSAPYYVISFNPPHADQANEYHDLRVQIDQPGLTAKTSSGYYNQP